MKSLDIDHGGIDVGGGREPSGHGEADHVGVIGDHVSIPWQVFIQMIFLISYLSLFQYLFLAITSLLLAMATLSWGSM